MTILYVLIPVTFAMGLVGLAAFLWSLAAGQYEDLSGAAERVLLDEDEALRRADPRRNATETADDGIEETP